MSVSHVYRCPFARRVTTPWVVSLYPFVCLLLLLLLDSQCVAALSGRNVPATSVARIQVCQNKDCCKQWSKTGSPFTSLPDTLHDLIPPVSLIADEEDLENNSKPQRLVKINVETTGCLGHCGKGPNLQVFLDNQDETVLQGIDSVALLAVQIGATCHVKFPPKLLAAVKVMEKANKATSLEEKIKCLDSVVRVLNDPEQGGMWQLHRSIANAHAHVLRAKAYSCSISNAEATLRDADMALGILSDWGENNVRTQTLAAIAWRIKADTYEAMGNVQKAVEAFQQCAKINPQLRDKMSKEIQRILERSKRTKLPTTL